MSNLSDLLTNAQAILLDRDGCLNKKSVDSRYVEKLSQIDFFEDAIDFLRAALLKNMQIAVVTNQQGISKKLYELDDVILMHQKLCKLVGSDNERFRLFVCPHEVSTCDCRKPSPKMLLQACEQFGIPPNRAVFIGDSDSDMQAARNADMPFILMNRIIDNSGVYAKSYSLTNFEPLTKILQGSRRAEN